MNRAKASRVTRSALGAVGLCVLALGLLSVSVVARASGPKSRVPLDILVLAGQSNALGAKSYAIDPVTGRHVFVRASAGSADRKVLFMWTESGVPSSGPTPVALDTPQHLVRAPSPVFGPEVGLARKLWSDGFHDLLVVKVAFNGTSLAVDWQPGRPDFAAMLRRVRQAEAWADAHGYLPRIAGFYWVQGEADAGKGAWAARYATNLRRFINEVRRDLELGPSTPFVLAQTDLADYIAWEQAHRRCVVSTCAIEKRWNDWVMEAQARAASPDVFVIPTFELPRVEHFVHLSNASEIRLGVSFARVTAPRMPPG